MAADVDDTAGTFEAVAFSATTSLKFRGLAELGGINADLFPNPQVGEQPDR